MNYFKCLIGALMVGLVGMMTQMSSAATWYVSPNDNDGKSDLAVYHNGSWSIDSMAGNTTNTIYITNTVSGEYLAVGDGTTTAFNGQLAHTPVRGSLTIYTTGGYRFTDSASTSADTVSLAVTPADGSVGSITYSTRAWALTFPAPLANGTQILGTYAYVTVVNPDYCQIYLNYANYYFNRYASTRSSTDLYWFYYCYAYVGYYFYLNVGQTSWANSFYYYYMCYANSALANDYHYRFTRTGSHLYLGYYCYYAAFSYFYGYMYGGDSYNAYRWYYYYMYYANWYWAH